MVAAPRMCHELHSASRCCIVGISLVSLFGRSIRPFSDCRNSHTVSGVNFFRRQIEKVRVLIMLGNIVGFFDGKKQMIASLGAALIATGTIVANFAQMGFGYASHMASTPEFAAASVGWIGFFNALKGEKIRSEIATPKGEIQK